MAWCKTKGSLHRLQIISSKWNTRKTRKLYPWIFLRWTKVELKTEIESNFFCFVISWKNIKMLPGRIQQYKSFILFSATNFGNSILYLCKARGPGLGFEMALKIWETVQFDLKKTEAMAWWANWHWKVEFNVPDLSIKTMATHNLFIGGFYVQKIVTILKFTLTPVYFQKECIMFWLL